MSPGYVGNAPVYRVAPGRRATGGVSESLLRCNLCIMDGKDLVKRVYRVGICLEYTVLDSRSWAGMTAWQGRDGGAGMMVLTAR